jgi:hypothetical protein
MDGRIPSSISCIGKSRMGGLQGTCLNLQAKMPPIGPICWILLHHFFVYLYGIRDSGPQFWSLSACRSFAGRIVRRDAMYSTCHKQNQSYGPEIHGVHNENETDLVHSSFPTASSTPQTIWDSSLRMYSLSLSLKSRLRLPRFEKIAYTSVYLFGHACPSFSLNREPARNEEDIAVHPGRWRQKQKKSQRDRGKSMYLAS